MATNKHITLDDRFMIQSMLNSGASICSIAKKLNRSKSTISREIKKHISFKKTGCIGHPFSDCVHRRECREFHFCTYNEKCLSHNCKRCSICYLHCSKYVKYICPKLYEPPYVCNHCTDRGHCQLEKRIYSAQSANDEYRLCLRESRSGVCMTEDEALRLDELISPLIENGQSIHHIMLNNKPSIMYSERSLYKYLDLGMFTARNINLPRKVRFNPTKSSHEHLKIDKKCRIGRTIDDYRKYIEEHPDTNTVEIDSVIGTTGGKCLLTIHFVRTELMLAFLRDANTSASVTNIFNALYEKLGHDLFMKLFPVILTDNGSEFSDPVSIETDQDGVIRTRIFYCDPAAPYQKGAAENNHEFIRRVLPKGTSMNELTQENIDLMMNHINSYKRENLAGKSPCEVFGFLFSDDVLELLGVKPISPNDIVLRPSLIK